MTLLANITVTDAGFFIAGVALCFGFLWWKDQNARKLQSAEAESILEKSRRDSDTFVRDARLAANEEALKVREQTEQSFASRRQELAESERRLGERESLINTQLEKLVQVEKSLQDQKGEAQKEADALTAQQLEFKRLTQQRREQLQALAHLTPGEARTQFLKEIEQEAMHDASKLCRDIVDAAKSRAEDKARAIICLAIQRYAGEHTFETTTATIALQGEEMKGRIIGRDGRNIRAFEAATGITVLIDDTPNAVVLSGFDPVRREIAREAMTRLILDGRIHPTRIEEIVAKVAQEMDETIDRQ